MPSMWDVMQGADAQPQQPAQQQPRRASMWDALEATKSHVTITPENYMQLASERVKEAQQQMRQATGRDLNARQQVAIVDAYRQAAGQPTALAGRDFHQEARARAIEQSPIRNWAANVGATFGEFGAGIVGAASPETASRMREQTQQYYGPPGGGVSGFAGRAFGGAALMAPALATGGAAAAATPGVFGLSAFGGARADIAERRKRGEEIGVAQEYAAAVLHGVVEAAMERFGMDVARGLGRAMGAGMPELRSAFAREGAKGASRWLSRHMPNIIRRGAPAIAEGGAEEALTQIGQNLTNRFVAGDEDVTTFQGVGEAAAQGAILPVAMAPITARSAARQPRAETGREEPAAPLPPQQAAALLRQFNEDPRFPTEIKDRVAVAVEQAGPEAPIERIIEDHVRAFVQEQGAAESPERPAEPREAPEGDQARDMATEPTERPPAAQQAPPPVGSQVEFSLGGGAFTRSGTVERIENGVPLVRADHDNRLYEISPERGAAWDVVDQARQVIEEGRAAEAPEQPQAAQPQPEAPDVVDQARQIIEEGREEAPQQEAPEQPPAERGVTEAVIREQIARQAEEGERERVRTEALIRQAQEILEGTRAIEQEAQAAQAEEAGQAEQAAPTAEEGQQIAERLEIRHDGTNESGHWFTDPQTKSSFLVPPGKDASTILEETRARFRQQERPEKRAESAQAQELQALNVFQLRKTAREQGVDVADISGKGSKQRIIERILAQQEAQPSPAEAAEPEGGQRLTEQQEREQARQREAEEQFEARPGRGISPEAAEIFNMAIMGQTPTKEQRQQLGDEKELLQAINESEGADVDSVTRYIAKNMGLVKSAAQQMVGQGSMQQMDDIVSVGVSKFYEAMTAPVRRGKHKGRMRAEVLLEGARPSTFLFGRNGIVRSAMRDAAFPAMGRRLEAGQQRAETFTRPEGSLDALAETQTEEGATAADLQAGSVAEQRAKKAQLDPEDSGLPIPPEVIGKYAKTVNDMKNKGASDEEILGFLADQPDVHFMPGTVLLMLESQATGASIVQPKSNAEKAVSRLAQDMGLDVMFYRGGSAEIGGMAADGVIALKSGQTEAGTWEMFFHEAAHDLDMDRLFLSKRNERLLEQYKQQYLRRAPGPLADFLRRNPSRLRREAAALMIGELARDPKVRRRLQHESPGLARRLWESLKRILKAWAGKNTLVDEVIRQWDWNGLGYTVEDSPPMFSPMPQDPLGKDIQSFLNDLAKVQAERPKITGRPWLSNPMRTEPSRRIQDMIDQRLKEAGEPVPETFKQWQERANAILRDRNRAADLEARMRAGEPLRGPEEEFAAQELVNRAALDVISNPSKPAMQEVWDLAAGRRTGRTEIARILTAGRDPQKGPRARLSEYVAGMMAEVPASIRERIERAEAQGKTKKAEKIKSDWSDRWMKVLRELQDKGLDPSKLQDIDATGSATKWAVVRTIERAYKPQGFWSALQEYRRNSLMWAPATLARNALGGAYAITDIFVTKPIARIMEQAVYGKNRSGETQAAWHTLASRATWARALRHMIDTIIYEVPSLDIQVQMGTHVSAAAARQTEIYQPPAITGEKVRDLVTRGLGRDIGETAGKLTGMLGHAIRSPQRLNAGIDQFFKTLHAHSEVAAHAVEAGKRDGMEPGSQQMADFVEAEIEDPASASWGAAARTGETNRVAFQARAGQVEELALELRKRVPVFGLIVPFIKSPIQLAGQAAMHIPGMGAIEMGHRAVQAARGRRAYGSAEVTRHVTQQLLGMLALSLLWDLVDDEDGEPLLTPPGDYSRKRRGERITTQAVRPPSHVKIGGEYWSYRNMEPFSTVLGTAAALAYELRANTREGKRPSETAGRLWSRLTTQFTDQTYIRQVGDIVKAVQDPESFTAERMVTNFAGSWLPNLVDVAMRAEDPYIRERKRVGEPGERATLGKQIARQAWPTENILPPPKVDFFGEDIMVPGHERPRSMMLQRILSPSLPRRIVEGRRGDVLRMLIRYNQGRPVEQQVWFQEPSYGVQVRRPNQPKKVREELNEREYYLLNKLAGMQVGRAVDATNWNTKNPTYADIRKLEQIISKARRAAREPLARARQMKALGRDGAYERIIDELERRITGSE